ncbi:MAG TPA: pyridoxal-dependent decarboxylase [Gemmatimonadales bacterium]|nr:pyridoxal-dependent decarboxylase [Gemmatimonadales bacterium]
MPDPELTLDPTDWSAIRALGHRMIDDMFDHLGGIREQPAWREMPPEVKQSFRGPVPFEGRGLGEAYAGFQERVLPYTAGNVHPRFWGWVMGSGSAEGMLAELLAAGLNINCGGFDNPPTHVELQVLDWCRGLFGFPADSGAAIVSGGSMANFVALAVARDATAGSAAEQGLRNLDAPLAFYCSDQTHNSVSKALRLLGLGREALRSVPTTAAYEIDLAALDRMIAEDRARGVRPACVIGNAGTVNAGATDDLEALAAVATREGMWFHVDGAFGAIAMLSPALRKIVKGIERADSLAFDFHKWLHVQYDAGCVLVRSAEAHKKPFTEPASYLKWMDRGYAAGPGQFRDYAPELSRQFKALKIWIAFQSHGVDVYRRLAEQNVAQAKYLTGLVESNANLELLAPTALNVVNFRYRRDGLTGEQLDAVNQEVLMRLQEEGLAVPSGTMLRGKFAIRCAITNHRSRREDFDALVGAVVRLGVDAGT